MNPKPPQSSTQMSLQASNRGEKRVPSPSITTTTAKCGSMKDHQESVETTSQTKVIKKDVKAKIKNDDNSEQKEKEKKIDTVQATRATNTNGKSIELPVVQQQVIVETNDKKTIDNSAIIKLSTVPEDKDSEPIKPSIENDGEEAIKKQNDNNESDEKAHVDVPKLELNDSIEKLEEEPKISVENNKKIVTNDERPSGSNLVESTTSESPVKNPETVKDEKITEEEQQQNDASFICYDSNILLKDVQIKLNDCLKENTKLLDVTDPNASMSEAFKDLSFGRTLRGISGRNSISRLRNVTVREHKASPNDSLFVNTSSASIVIDTSRYAPDSPCHNGSQSDRKRKFIADESSANKKYKTEAGYSLLNTSLEYLKNLRRPVQVSTPNAREFKFDFNEKTHSLDQTMTIDETIEPKKWCVVM